MPIIISDAIRKKLSEKHRVEEKEVTQCFENLTGGLLIDVRDEHQTDPKTQWFIARTNMRRLLKVCFIPIGQDQHLKSAFEPNEMELRIYRAKAIPSPHDL